MVEAIDLCCGFSGGHHLNKTVEQGCGIVRSWARLGMTLKSEGCAINQFDALQGIVK